MLQKPCPRCGKMMDYGPAYCPACAPLAAADAEAAKERRIEQKRKQYNRTYNKKRDPKFSRFYKSKPWRLMSKAKLEDVNYKCEAGLEGCTRLACEVHHKKPIQTQEGWDERLEWDNLEAVCISCHNGRHPEKFKRKKIMA